ncbi:helix-turn-helix transcriptional regulator [Sedimentibacter sp.]|uniref:PadR family transcriptional regulator n=1 Tax=Sedimentibacter sp. TaxID=1960295 RepID=UPI00289FE766|nr:helix-turn-helix transcriptional regulator [Sedimentibacter sp.]
MAREQLKTLTEQMYYILLTLTERQHGYGIMQEVDRRTGGRVKIGAGTLYSLLSRFEEEDIIVQVAEEDRRKIYTLTEKGLNILRDEHKRLKQLVLDGNDILEGRVDLHEK